MARTKANGKNTKLVGPGSKAKSSSHPTTKTKPRTTPTAKPIPKTSVQTIHDEDTAPRQSAKQRRAAKELRRALKEPTGRCCPSCQKHGWLASLVIFWEIDNNEKLIEAREELGIFIDLSKTIFRFHKTPVIKPKETGEEREVRLDKPRGAKFTYTKLREAKLPRMTRSQKNANAEGMGQ